ncbi:TonB-dependent siderophore receptor [Pseudoduganella namucuonensis]|uniref:Iron complex outermembrane recepter protein n=1 Tax=Pseudoduganella namucuonensis TaxID=1035707 RepID=A0A1I7JM89_9BURK|nr:TonB-dependent siderophore receptor [Pseudoduganella namucuonensis]SFU86266.1 iron complex outermembrane recepter protein [Pseudoduganella namucuonensis]
MSIRNFAVSAIALAISQAFAPAACADDAPADTTMTEVVITGARSANANRSSVAGFTDMPLLLTPASVTVLSRERMQELNIRSTTDAAKFDASISDAYNAVGYAEQFSIRGFKLNNASSYRKDGLAISGDTQIPLENKEAIEVLKGLAGLQSGLAAPGGIVNYITKRPTDTALRSVTVEASERGTLLGHVDLGGRFGDSRFGYRINAAGERLRSYIKGADGHRNFVSAAFDWQISPQALLQIDGDYQKKSQLSAPGFQLINNVTLPNVAADTMLNDQPWAKPVETESSNLGARFLYQFNSDWNATVSANRHSFKRDDYTAFPYGCGAQDLYPGFCANGDYDVYDYRSLGEAKRPQALQAMVQGKFATGAFQHAATFGYSYFKNSERWGDYVYDWAGVSNIYRPVAVAPSTGVTGAASERRNDHERAVFVQDVVGLTDQLKLHAGVRHAQVERNEAGVEPSDQGFLLPNVSLVFSPKANVSAYASWAKGLEHGGIAPMQTTNENRALSASVSKQIELGVKADVHKDLSLAMAVFQIRQGLEYTDAANTFVRNGQRQHRGLEMTAQGKVARDLNIAFTAMALDTEQSGTGQAAMDGKRVTNVPKFKSSVYAEYALPQVAGLKVNANVQYASRKAFDPENTTFVPGYSVVNMGASYSAKFGATAAVFRAQVYNVTNKFYWRDVTPDLGGYLFPGAERTVKLSAQLDF